MPVPIFSTGRIRRCKIVRDVHRSLRRWIRSQSVGAEGVTGHPVHGCSIWISYGQHCSCWGWNKSRLNPALLDLCCGPGRHSVPLAKQGFTVTGVDRSAFLLGKAKAYGEREQVNVTWIKEDMRRFVQPGTFNLAMSMFSS